MNIHSSVHTVWPSLEKKKVMLRFVKWALRSFFHDNICDCKLIGHKLILSFVNILGSNHKIYRGLFPRVSTYLRMFVTVDIILSCCDWWTDHTRAKPNMPISAHEYAYTKNFRRQSSEERKVVLRNTLELAK